MHTTLAHGRAFAWIVLVVLFIWGGLNCWKGAQTLWPGLHQDGAIYSTVAINRAAGLGNLFDVYSFNLLLDRNSNEFNWHGQLYYPVVAALMRGATYADFLRLLHEVNFFGYVLAFLVFILASRRSLACSWLVATAFAVGGTWSTTAILYYLQGRPEHAIPIILLLFALIRELLKRTLPPWMSGVEVGVVGAVSPLPGFLLAVSAAFAASSKAQNSRQCLLGVAGIAAGAIVTWGLLMTAAYPGSLIDLVAKSLAVQKYIYAFMAQSHRPFPFFNTDWFVSYWFSHSFMPGVGLLYLIALFVLLCAVIKELTSEKPLLTKFVIGACLLLPLNQIWFSAFARSPINYTFVAFFPSVLIWTLEGLGRHASLRQISVRVLPDGRPLLIADFPRWLNRSVVLLLLLAAIAFPGISFAKTALLQHFVSAQGNPYSETLDRFTQLKKSLGDNEYILIDLYTNPRSAVVFDGPPWKTRAYEQQDGPLEKVESELGFRGKYIFYLQDRGNAPPPRDGLRVVETRFNSSPVRLFGYTIEHITPGYGFAIYERVEQPHNQNQGDPKTN